MQHSHVPGFLLTQAVKPQREQPLSATAVPVFIGYVQRCSGLELGKLALVERYADYEQLFCNSGGGEDANPWLAPGANDGNGAAGPFLRSSLHLYFLNGGGPCYVLPVGLLHADHPPQVAHFKGLQSAIDGVPTVTLILPTDAILLPEELYYQFCRDLLDYCAEAQNRFCLFDACSVAGQGYPHARAFVAGLRSQNLHLGAAYFPALQLEAMPSKVGAASRPADAPPRIALASAAAAAGYYVTDTTRGVWKAPANVEISGVLGLATTLSLQEMGNLYMPEDGKSVNMLRSLHGRGIYLWGARTMAGHNPEWRFVNVRRLMHFVQSTLRNRTLFAAFEPNTMRTWIVVKGLCESFLQELWEAGGLAGADQVSAYEVAVGLGQSMTQAEIDAGQLVITVKIAVRRPTEFITLKIFHQVQALGNQ